MGLLEKVLFIYLFIDRPELPVLVFPYYVVGRECFGVYFRIMTGTGIWTGEIARRGTRTSIARKEGKVSTLISHTTPRIAEISSIAPPPSIASDCKVQALTSYRQH